MTPTFRRLPFLAMCLAFALVAMPLRAATPEKPHKKQVADRFDEFTFATIADSHIRTAGSPDPRYLKAMDRATEILANYVSDINARSPAISFAVHLGDVTDLGDSLEFEAARSVVSDLACPLYSVVGNHDNFKSDAKRGWKAFSGLDETNYSFDHLGYHFVVIDCTLDPYQYPYVNCDSTVRAWVARDLATNGGEPTIVFSHFNMWERPWNPMFDTTLVYAQYQGMPELRTVLENAGNVIAVVNGHVHANRVEEHRGIYYVDVAATLVGPPSIRYFHLRPDRIDVTYEYISDRPLAEYVASLCPLCCCCSNPGTVCDFVDGLHSDKQFTIPVKNFADVPLSPAGPEPGHFDVTLVCDGRRVQAKVSADVVGTVQILFTDVLGRSLARLGVRKAETDLEIDLDQEMARIQHLPPGIYFVRFSLGEQAATRKLVLVQ